MYNNAKEKGRKFTENEIKVTDAIRLRTIAWPDCCGVNTPSPQWLLSPGYESRGHRREATPSSFAILGLQERLDRGHPLPTTYLQVCTCAPESLLRSPATTPRQHRGLGRGHLLLNSPAEPAVVAWCQRNRSAEQDRGSTRAHPRKLVAEG